MMNEQMAVELARLIGQAEKVEEEMRVIRLDHNNRVAAGSAEPSDIIELLLLRLDERSANQKYMSAIRHLWEQAGGEKNYTSFKDFVLKLIQADPELREVYSGEKLRVLMISCEYLQEIFEFNRYVHFIFSWQLREDR